MTFAVENMYPWRARSREIQAYAPPGTPPTRTTTPHARPLAHGRVRVRRDGDAQRVRRPARPRPPGRRHGGGQGRAPGARPRAASPALRCWSRWRCNGSTARSCSRSRRARPRTGPSARPTSPRRWPSPGSISRPSRHDVGRAVVPTTRGPPSWCARSRSCAGGRRVLEGVDRPGRARDRSPGCSGPSGCGKITLMRAIVGVQVVAGGTVERARRCRPATRAAAPPGRLRHPGAGGLRRPDRPREPRATSPRCSAPPAPTCDRGRRGVDLGDARRTRSSAGSPAASEPGSRLAVGAARAAPSCWSSTSRPSASTRCCAATSGRCSPARRRRARRCSSPAT